MYLMFKFDPQTGNYTVISQFCDPMRDARKDDVKARESMIKGFIKRADLQHGLKDAGFKRDCRCVAHGVGNAELDFHLHLVLAFWRLDPSARQKRERTAQAVFNTYFGQEVDPLAVTVPTPDGSVSVLRMLVTVPDALLEAMARIYCKIAAIRIASTPLDQLDSAALKLAPAVSLRRALIEGMRAKVTSLAGQTDLLLMSECAWTSQSGDGCGRLTAAVIELLGSKQGLKFLVKLRTAFERPSGGWNSIELDAIGSAVRERGMTPQGLSDEAIIEWYRRQSSELEQQYYQSAIEATLEAVSNGTDLGAFTHACRTAMAKFQLTTPVVDEEAMRKLLAKTKADIKKFMQSLDVIRFTKECTVRSPWIRHCWRWALDLLAQWTDGMLCREDSPPFDLSEVCRDLSKSGKARWSTADVENVIRVGLDAAWWIYANAVKNHLDAVERAMPDAPRAELQSISEELLHLSRTRLDKKATEMRALLERADRAIELARLSLAPSTTFDTSAFARKIAELLKSNPPVYTLTAVHFDKLPALDFSEWVAIAQALDGQWLGDLTSLKVSESLPAAGAMSLGEDAALAIAVEAPTPYANGDGVFINAILWRRRRGSQHPPTVDGRPAAPMDRAHWYSTLVVCARFCVPVADPKIVPR